MLDLGALILGGLCFFVPIGVTVWGLTLLVRSGGRLWRSFLLVAVGCLLSWFLFPALFDYGWIRTVFSLRIIVPGTMGCLGLVCIALGLRAMLGFQRPR